MLGGEAGSTSRFILPDQEQIFFFFWACSTANFQFPCQTYLTHICCMPIRLWERRGPKAQPSVNVTIPVSECCSAWMLLWFLGWGESDSPEKRTIYTVNCGYTLTCSPSRTKGNLLRGLKERNIFRPKPRVMRWPTSLRVVQCPRCILGGQKVSRFSRPDPRDLFQAPRCSLGSVAFRLWPFVRKTQRISGERTQEFRAGGGRVFTDIAQLQLQTMLFWISALALPQFAVIGFIKQRESWVILGHGIQFSEAHVQNCQFPNIFGLSVLLKLQSQNFLENWQLLMWIEHLKGFPNSDMRTCRKTHLGKTWFNPMGNPQFFKFKDLKFGTTSHSTVMGKAFSSCWQALALPWSWSVWHPGTMLCVASGN